VTRVFVGLGARTSRRRATALLLATAAHVLLIAALIWQARPWTDEERGSAPVIEVRLAPLQTPPQTRSPRHPAAHPPTTAAMPPDSSAPRAVTQAPAAPALPSRESQPETPSAPQAPSGDARKALRAALGCSFAALANLTPDERQHCQDRFAQNRPGAPVQEFGVAPAKQAIFEANAKRALWWQQPFLATTPKNGCAPKITNQQVMIPGGAHAPSDWRAGISCGKAF